MTTREGIASIEFNTLADKRPVDTFEGRSANG
jgi:hypothetical protein